MEQSHIEPRGSKHKERKEQKPKKNNFLFKPIHKT